MAGERPHPHADIEWACPECDSTDISCVSRNKKKRGHMKAPCHCFDCGVHFHNPKELELEQ